MMKKSLAILALAAATLAAEVPPAFTLTLALKGAHVAKLIIECRPGATAGFDRAMDIYVPPSGMGTGFAGITIPDNKGLFFYKDVRPTTFPQTWTIDCVPLSSASPVVITWDHKSLPDSLSFSAKVGSGNPIDMHKISTLRIKKKSKVIITATPLKQ